MNAITVIRTERLNENAGLQWVTPSQTQTVGDVRNALAEIAQYAASSSAQKLFEIFSRLDSANKGEAKARQWIVSLNVVTPKNINTALNNLAESIPKAPVMLFSDIDNTLVHKQSTANTQQIPDENAHVDRETQNLLTQLRGKIPVVLISGRRASSYDRVRSSLPHEYGILEHGCVVYRDGLSDTQFLSRLQPWIGSGNTTHDQGVLWDYERSLQARGLRTDSSGRIASFRVDPAKNKMSMTMIEQLERGPHPAGITTVRNLSWIDFIPALGGKQNAIMYVLSQQGVAWQDIACFGDDYNDLEMLTQCGLPCTVASARKPVIELVRRRRGYVSNAADHAGTIEVLRWLLLLVNQ